MIISSGPSLNLFGKVMLSTCHVQNRIPYKKIDKTPYELWRGYKLNLSHLKV